MTQQNYDSKPKTIIGVLASHDDVEKNNDLIDLFEELYEKDTSLFENFHFVFSGGTFKRVVLGEETEEGKNGKLKKMKERGVKEYLLQNLTALPDRLHGGVTILSNMIVQRQCSIIWPFFSSATVHWLHPENLALIRLCDIWNEKRLMNRGSVKTWFLYEAARDVDRNPQTFPLKLKFCTEGYTLGEIPNLVSKDWQAQASLSKDCLMVKEQNKECGRYYVPEPIRKKRTEQFWLEFDFQTVALIAHDEMKGRMVDFAIEYERELAVFGRILATGTTGREVQEATRRLKNIWRCRSGPKGGDIEIATEILYGRCDIVIFFIDPLHPHPHMEDIRTVFSACMIEGEVRMLTNEVQAREWMDEVVRPHVKKPRQGAYQIPFSDNTKS